MATIVVRNLDEEVKHQLRMRAARHGRSMEAEVRAILEESVRKQENFGEAIMEAFGALGGVELDIPPRTMEMRAVEFDE
ncbi:MAG: plasmid stabilization protein [Catenulispora sp. 13_1_20CM_3_70_7]|nr:Arc family DNA-binding protein [Catenulisporales bacterium]OLE20991.1 MAG: plasmid stabilization protein [Catenulispora sp. 13_1_20CM_3_70_7]